MLADKVKELESSNAQMKHTLSEIAKLCAYHKPLSESAQHRIQRMAETAVQGAYK
jgi:protein subunit release factor A